MIAIVDGRGVGAGKSYFTCNWILGHLAKGGTVYVGDSFGFVFEEAALLIAERYGVQIERDQLRTFSAADAARLHEVTSPGTEENPVLVIYDEAQQGLNSRDWADRNKRPLFDWLCQSRHDNNDVLFVTQNRNNIDKQIARLVSNMFCVRNMANFSILGIGKWPLKQFLVLVLDGDGKTLQERRWLWQDKAVFKCYVSKSMQGTHKRGGAAIPKKKLAVYKGRARRGRMLLKLLLIFGVLGGVGYGAYRQISGWGKPPVVVAPAAVAGGTLVASSVPVPGPLPAFDQRTEKLLGHSGRWIHSDKGEYEVGRICPDGIVRVFDGRGMSIQQPNGRMLLVSFSNGTAVARISVSPARSAQAARVPSTVPRVTQNNGINVRGFTPRSWKTKSGETKHAANFVLLDLSPSPIMETIAMAVEYEGEAQVRQASELVGKTCLASITGFRVGMNGKVELLGSIVAKK